MLQPPIDLELTTVDFSVVPEAGRIDRARVVTPNILGERTEQDLVRVAVLERELIKFRKARPTPAVSCDPTADGSGVL